MADFIQAVVTNLGAAAEATAIANGWTILFTRVQVGKGITLGATDPKTLTALLSPVALVSPDPNAPNANLIGVNNLVPYQVAIQFQLAEAGLFARLNNGAEFLYAYAYAGTSGDIITASGSGSPVDNQYTFLIPYSNAPTIAVTLGVYPQVNLHALNHLDSGIDALPLSSLTRTGVVSANPNDFTQVWTGSNPPAWRPGLLTLRSNVTLYVSPAGNDATAIANDITHPFLTHQGAINWLGPYFILPNVQVTIQTLAGTYPISSTITLVHPQSAQISIIGPNNPITTFTGIGSITGSAGNWSVQLTGVLSTASLSVNGYLILYDSGGIANLANYIIDGFFQVTAISGSTVTIKVPYWGASFPSLAGITIGTIQPITAIISCASNITGISCSLFGINTLLYLCIISPGNSSANNISGVSISGSGNLVNLGVSGFKSSANNSVGITSLGKVGNLTLDRCGSSGNTIGIQGAGGGSFVSISKTGVTNNSSYGMWFDSGSLSGLSPNAANFASGNGSYGILIGAGSFVEAFGPVYVSWNNNWGILSTQLSQLVINAASGGAVTAQNNVTNDAGVLNVSVITGQSLIFGSRIFNQSVGSLTANGLIN